MPATTGTGGMAPDLPEALRPAAPPARASPGWALVPRRCAPTGRFVASASGAADCALAAVRQNQHPAPMTTKAAVTPIIQLFLGRLILKKFLRPYSSAQPIIGLIVSSLMVQHEGKIVKIGMNRHKDVMKRGRAGVICAGALPGQRLFVKKKRRWRSPSWRALLRRCPSGPMNN